MTKLLYISSLGHSGSTILDLLCGNLPRVVSLGEAHFISWQLSKRGASDNPQSRCSCGMQFKDCEFWNKVIYSLGEKHNVDLFGEPEQFDMSINRNIRRYGFNIHHRALDHALGVGAMANSRMLLRGISRLYRVGARRTWDLFDTISSVDEEIRWVVDSSKNIARYFYLREQRPRNTRLLVLIRGAEGFCSSAHHGISDLTVSKKLRTWRRFYGRIIPGFLRRLSEAEFLVVPYEKLCTNPVYCLQRISNLLGSDHLVSDRDTVLNPFLRHTIQGNPIRLKREPMRISYDERWRKRLSGDQVMLAKEVSEEIYGRWRAEGFPFI